MTARLKIKASGAEVTFESCDCLECDQLRVENERLKEHLRDYARHNEGCSGCFDGCRCKCGYDEDCKEWEEDGDGNS